jgi:hypothetical protein
MQYLKITQTNGTATYYPGTTSFVTIAAPILVGNVVVNKGKVTSASYSKIVGTSMTYVTDTVAAFNGANAKYELGKLAQDGAFTVAHSN